MSSEGSVDKMPSECPGDNGASEGSNKIPSECPGDKGLSEGSEQMVPCSTSPLFGVVEGLKKLVSLGILAASPCSSSSCLHFLFYALGIELKPILSRLLL